MQVWALLRRGEPEPVELYWTREEAQTDRVRADDEDLAELLYVRRIVLDGGGFPLGGRN